MATATRLPEPTHGPWVTNLDPLQFQWSFSVNYNVSYAQDSPFFHALAKRKLLGSECQACNYRYATPRTVCMSCGGATAWFELPTTGRVHSWTVCHFSGEPYLDQCPFTLALIEFDGVDTLFMTRVIGSGEDEMRIGMPVSAKFRRKKTWSVTDVYFVKA